MITAITAALTAIKEFFGWRTSVTQNKPALEVVKDKKSLKKGTNYAEKIFEITDVKKDNNGCFLLRRWKAPNNV